MNAEKPATWPSHLPIIVPFFSLYLFKELFDKIVGIPNTNCGLWVTECFVQPWLKRHGYLGVNINFSIYFNDFCDQIISRTQVIMKKVIILMINTLLITFYITAQTPNERLQQLVGTWNLMESSFVNPAGQMPGTMIVASAANGQAIYTIYKQGSGDNYYEANALWGYSEQDKQIRVFEVNTLGTATTHFGNFDTKGALIIELHDPNTNDLLQHRVMSWTSDTLKINARFISNGEESNAFLVMVRKKD